MTHWEKLSYERVSRGDVEVFRLSGQLTSSPESYALLDTVREAARKKHRRIVFEMSGVPMITSNGIGIIAACCTTLTNADGRLVIAALNQRCRVALNVVRMLDIIPSAESEDEAVERAGA